MCYRQHCGSCSVLSCCLVVSIFSWVHLTIFPREILVLSLQKQTRGHNSVIICFRIKVLVHCAFHHKPALIPPPPPLTPAHLKIFHEKQLQRKIQTDNTPNIYPSRGIKLFINDISPKDDFGSH